jgi:hypothetical protein
MAGRDHVIGHQRHLAGSGHQQDPAERVKAHRQAKMASPG